MIPLPPSGVYPFPVLELKFPDLNAEQTYVFEEQIELQRWLVKELNQRWHRRPRPNDPELAKMQDLSVNDFLRMVFRHYYDQGTNFTLQGKRFLGFDAVWIEPIQSFQLNPIVEQGPMTIEVKEINNDSA